MANFLKNLGNSLVNTAKQSIIDEVSDTNFGRALRTLNILPGANPDNTSSFASGSWDTGTNADWRVRISVPPGGTYGSSTILSPLRETQNSMVFPYTPQVFITHSANYSALQPTHSNYPFQIYSNSSVDAFTITGEFTVENSKEAEYWIAAVHFLRSITKMAYGDSSNKGSPPPVVKLNGYGDYVFNNVPVVIQNFNVTLPSDVDYIPASIGFNGSYAPTKSEISVSMVPAYSRDKVNKFSLDKFVNGGYILGGDGYI